MIALVALLILLQLIFMLPIKDKRERQRGFPWATVVLIGVNVLVHGLVFLLVLQRQADEPYEDVQFRLLYPLMLIPQLIIDGRGLGAFSVVSSGFLHGDLQHLLGNMFLLWFFGRKVEDATGPFRFGLFYLLCLFGSSLVSVLVNVSLSSLNAQTPALGASGAVSGVMAAYLFLYSDERILTLFSVWVAPVIPIPIPGGCFIPTPVPVWLPAWVFIIFQFLRDAVLGQFIQEITALSGPISYGIGVFAHLGGAAAGMLFIFIFMHPDVFAQRR